MNTILPNSQFSSGTGPTFNCLIQPVACLTPASEVMNLMSKMSDICTRRSLENIAVNPRTPVNTLNDLAYHQSEDVRIAVSENPSTPLDTLFILTCDEHPDVRYSLAENSNLPLQILELLARDDNPYVGARADRSIAIKKRTIIAAL